MDRPLPLFLSAFLDAFEQGKRSNNSRIIDALLFSFFIFSCLRNEIVDNFIIIFSLRRYKANCEKEERRRRREEFIVVSIVGTIYNDIENDNFLFLFLKINDNYEKHI